MSQVHDDFFFIYLLPCERPCRPLSERGALTEHERATYRRNEDEFRLFEVTLRLRLHSDTEPISARTFGLRM